MGQRQAAVVPQIMGPSLLPMPDDEPTTDKYSLFFPQNDDDTRQAENCGGSCTNQPLNYLKHIKSNSSGVCLPDDNSLAEVLDKGEFVYDDKSVRKTQRR